MARALFPRDRDPIVSAGNGARCQKYVIIFRNKGAGLTVLMTILGNVVGKGGEISAQIRFTNWVKYSCEEEFRVSKYWRRKCAGCFLMG